MRCDSHQMWGKRMRGGREGGEEGRREGGRIKEGSADSEIRERGNSERSMIGLGKWEGTGTSVGE